MFRADGESVVTIKQSLQNKKGRRCVLARVELLVGGSAMGWQGREQRRAEKHSC